MHTYTLEIESEHWMIAQMRKMADECTRHIAMLETARTCVKHSSEDDPPCIVQSRTIAARSTNYWRRSRGEKNVSVNMFGTHACGAGRKTEKALTISQRLSKSR